MRSTVTLLQCLLQGWCEQIMVMSIQLHEKTEKNPHHYQYHQKHHLLAIVMKKLLMQIKFVGNNGKQTWWIIYSNIACPNRRCYRKYWRRSSLEGLHYLKIYSMWNIKHLKMDAFKIPDNKNIGKLFSKFELLFLDHANPSSDPSQISILQFPIARASLPPSPSLILP